MTSRTAFTASMRAQWDSAASGWNAHAGDTDSWLAAATSAMLSMAGVDAGSRVLDVAAGAAGQTLAAAAIVGAGGRVFATDLSPALVALGQARIARAGLANVRLEVADGQALPVESASFDAAVCRLGLMFFADPLRGLREMHRALRPGGRMCAMVFAGPERNPCVRILMTTALEHAGLRRPDPGAPGGLMSLGAPRRMDALVRDAGFHDVATVALDAPFRLPSVDHYLAFARESAGPILQILSRLDAAAQAAAWADMRERLRAFDSVDGWQGPNELLLTAGRRA